VTRSTSKHHHQPRPYSGTLFSKTAGVKHVKLYVA